MPQLRPEERRARAIIACDLGRDVEQHDDGSQPGMYDLHILGDDGEIVGAVEVTGAAHQERIEFWKVGVDVEQPWIDERLSGGWIVHVIPEKRSYKALRRSLPDVLAEFTADGITNYRASDFWHESQEHPVARELGVTGAINSESNHPGRIYLLPDISVEGGWVPDTGNPLVSWANGWINAPDQADNIEKLRRADVPERHLFIVLPGLTVAPDEAVMVLFRINDVPPLPTDDPDLTDHITHLWLSTSILVPYGLKWQRGGGWARFRAWDPDDPRLADAI